MPGVFLGHFCFWVRCYIHAVISSQNENVPSEESKECQHKGFFLRKPAKLTKNPAMANKAPAANIRETIWSCERKLPSWATPTFKIARSAEQLGGAGFSPLVPAHEKRDWCD